jgi:hypothetical protein
MAVLRCAFCKLQKTKGLEVPEGQAPGCASALSVSSTSKAGATPSVKFVTSRDQRTRRAGARSRRIIRAIIVSGQFATSQWRVVLEARDGTESQARAALESLCRAYWFPLYAYVVAAATTRIVPATSPGLVR